MIKKKHNPITAFLSREVKRGLTFLRLRVKELCGLGVTASTGAMVLALISHNPQDPSWNRATDSVTENWLGTIGAVFSDQALQFIGIGIWVALPALGAYGWRQFRHQKLSFWFLRLTAWIVAIACVCVSASLHVQNASTLAYLNENNALITPISGGLLGQLITLQLASLEKILSFDITQQGFRISLPLMLVGIVMSLTAAGGLRTSLQWLKAGGIKAKQFFTYLPNLSIRQENKEKKTLINKIKAGVQKPMTFILFIKAAISTAAVKNPNNESHTFRTSQENPQHPKNPKKKPSAIFSTANTAEKIPIETATKKPRLGTRTSKEDQHAMALGGHENFELPPLRLLTENRQRMGKKISDDALQANARLLEGVLEDFGIRGKILRVRPGPVITLYELEPAAGIRASRIVGLADDIARSMSAVACRVATVPGQNVIGIELPNHDRETVYLRELLASAEFEKNTGGLLIALGKDISGEAVLTDLARMPHLLVAGTTGSGKSVGVNAMILSILYRMSPAECRLIMVDPKMLELSVYDGIPHLLAPVVTEPKKAVIALKWAVQEMENRYRKMSKLGVRNIHGYNERMAEAIANKETLTHKVQLGIDPETSEAQFEQETIQPEKLPFIIIVIDEMADLMLVAGKELEGAIQRLAQMARAAGVHLITATQRPSVDVITGTIKANFPSRISFQVTSKIDSRTVLGEQGAEQLLGMGDMLYMAGGGRLQRVHGPFVSDAEVEKVVNFLKKQRAPDYVESVTTEPEDEQDFSTEPASANLYDQAVAIVTRDNRASISYVQRRLSIGYNRAATLIEQMEEQGVISSPNHAGKRDVLVGKH